MFIDFGVDELNRVVVILHERTERFVLEPAEAAQVGAVLTHLAEVLTRGGIVEPSAVRAVLDQARQPRDS